MVRRLLLAVLFCLSVWALAGRTSADVADDGARSIEALTADARTASTIGVKVATPPIDTHPPEARWEALLPHGIGGGSSRSDQRHPQLHAVDLPGVSSRAPWPVAHRVDAARHEARFRPPHLHHTPLLI